MNDSLYDFAVIGGGSAGFAGASTAARLGLRTVVIDGADELGGLCILRGCMPSKTLIESANRALTVRRGEEFGVRATLHHVDPAFVRDRKRQLIAEFADYRRGQLEGGKFELLRGWAHFLGPNELGVARRDGDRVTIKARAILIATGSTIWVPSLPGLAEAGFWTSDTLLDAAEVPDSFVIIGGGAIALESAHYLGGIGRQITIIQRGAEVLTIMDSDVGHVIAEAFRRRGMKIFTSTRLVRVERGASLKRVVFEHNGSEQSVEAAEILVAVGRRPAITGLMLEAAGVEIAREQVTTRPTQQTSQPHIFVAGDVCGPMEVVHLAVQQAEVAARNAAAWLRSEETGGKMDYRLKLFGVFTHPEAASVGTSESDAAQQGRAVTIGKHFFADHGKSMVMGEREGFVKLLGDPQSGQIIGASVVGPHATELIHEIVMAMRFHATAQELAAVPHYHPTLSEIWTYPAEEIAEQVADSARCD